MPSIAEYNKLGGARAVVISGLAALAVFGAGWLLASLIGLNILGATIIPMVVAFAAQVFVASEVERRIKRPERERVLLARCNVCVGCGLDLSDLATDATCPECGAAGRTVTRVKRWRTVLGIRPGEPIPRHDGPHGRAGLLGVDLLGLVTGREPEIPSIARFNAQRGRAGCLIAMVSTAEFVVIVAGAIALFPMSGWPAALVAMVPASVLITLTARLADRLFMRAERERILRARCNVCVECGFDVSGLPRDATCPECGVTHETRTRIVRWREALGVKPGERIPPPGNNP